MTASQKLIEKFNNGFHICTGLDTDLKKIPQHLLNSPDPVFEFNKIIIDNTYKGTAAYKLNLAFFESRGTSGIESMMKTIEYIPNDILKIGDAKRGDIGNTSQMYAQSIFDEFKFDSITVNPYMGFDSLEPFLKYTDKVSFILALTSNAGAVDFEKLQLTDGDFVYQKVITKANEWNKKNNCGIVFGATKLEELKSNISSFGNLFILLPGVGAQGGSLTDVVATFKQNQYSNYLINISRALIYADNTEDFGKAANRVLDDYNNQVIKQMNL
ncbi:MAG: orotidine-5'-phosphate decarboxylase [bacterium]